MVVFPDSVVEKPNFVLVLAGFGKLSMWVNSAGGGAGLDRAV